MVSYGAGALIVLTLSIGLALIIYGSGILEFNIFNIPSWIFGPLGAYTLIYGIASRRSSLYYSIWGTLMLAVFLVSTLYTVFNPVIIVGAAIIVIAILGLIARGRSGK
ncbi:MAG: hypothetical protein QW655_05835 [Nitrososphaerota archaeon]